MEDQTSEQTVTTRELRALLEKEGARLGRFFSVERGRARVEIVWPDRLCWVTAVDPD